MPKLSEIVGMNYDDFWNSRARFRVVKGSRASKKSTTAALWFIHNMMKYPDANLLVVRKVFNTLKDSSYSQLEWAINKLGVEKYWKLTVNPLEITYLPTKQKILFRGLDDSLKITSIIVPRGYLCWIWCEEAYEISDEAEFDKLVMSIRGHIPASTGLFKQVTLTFNPWRVCWIKDRFFDHPNESVFTKTTTYKDNEFLGPDDRAVFEQMAERNPRAAQTAVFGEWGSGEGAIYNNWHEKEFNIGQLKHDPNLEFAYGLDFGYVTSYNAFIAIAVDLAMHKIYIYDELYQKGMTNLDIAKMICKRGYGKEEIWADCAEPKSIYELSQGLIEATQLPNGQTEYTKYALPNIRPAHKGQDSVSNGIQRIQQFEIFVHPRCRNTVLELTNYSWEKDKSGKLTGKPEKEFDHLCLTGDTLILTKKGEIPLRDVRAGMMVMTHMGWRKVQTFVRTQENADIWAIELNDGTILSGTGNHQIITTRGTKYLKDVSKCDVVIKWQDQKDTTIPMQNTLNSTGNGGIDIPTPQVVQNGITSSDIMSDCTDMYGNTIMDQSQKEVRSITSTEILATMTSQTCNLSHLSSIDTSTPPLQNYVKCKESILQRTRINAEPGMPQKKGINGIKIMSETIYGQSDTSSASNAEKNSMPKTTGTIAFAHLHANQNGVVTPDSITRQEFVQSVVRNSQSTDSVKQDVVLRNVVRCWQTKQKENVYDITVEDAHDFYANGILVLNCDALRYSMDKFFIQGHTRFAEIKGGVSPYAPSVGGITEAASEETEFVANAKTLRLLAQPYEPDYTALCASDEAGTCADTSMVITVSSEPVQRTAEDFVPRRKVCRIAATREGGRNGR